MPPGRPLIDGGILWRGERILHAGARAEILRLKPKILADVPGAILMPGLINSHAHLELTPLAKKIPKGLPFTEWLLRVVKHKRRMKKQDVPRGVRAGEARLLQNGVTAVADNCSLRSALQTPRRLRSLLFQEIIGLAARPALPGSSKPICPHAPYSLSDENLWRIVQWWNRHPRAPLSMHVAESPGENEYFQSGRGPFSRFYSVMKIAPRSYPGRRVLDHLDRMRLVRHGLTIVHANDLTEEEANAIRRRDIAVAVCPGSLLYFGFSPASVRRLVEAGVQILIGTDSMASNIDLNLFLELRLARRLWNLPPRLLIEAATKIPGERFWAGRAGRLSPGAFADFLLVKMARRFADPYADLLHGRAERRILLRVLGGKPVRMIY